MALIEKKGYGQVEPNHLSAQRTGQIYAQTPAEEGIEILENGSFLKLDPKTNTLGTTGSGEWMLVYNEVKLYEVDKQGYKDFVQKAVETVRGEIVPRLFKTNVGDIFTTNMADSAVAGDKMVPTKEGKVGVLKKKATPEAGDMVFEVMKVTTMPDRQPAIKVVRVQ